MNYKYINCITLIYFHFHLISFLINYISTINITTCVFRRWQYTVIMSLITFGQNRVTRMVILASILLSSIPRISCHDGVGVGIGVESDESTLAPRVFIGAGSNSTLIPISTTTSLLVSTVAIVGLVLGVIFVFSALFTPGLKGTGANPFNFLGTGSYPQAGTYNSQYYTQQPYIYEPYSKLGYQNTLTR